MRISINDSTYASDINNWRYIYYKLNNSDEVFIPIVELNLNNITKSPVELLVYNLNPQEIPRLMNIMSKQSSMGLDKVIGIKSKFSLDNYSNESEISSGSIIRFYFPNFKYNDDGNKDYKELAVPEGTIPIYDAYCTEILILDSYKNPSNPLAIITGESDSSIKSKSSEYYGISEDISEATHKRVFTVLLTSNRANTIAEVSSHIDHKFNEHQGQSGLVLGDLRKGTYISKLFQTILSNDHRMTCINGVAISSEFTKFYLGTYTQLRTEYLVTARNRDNITTANGDRLIYIE